ncbi:hypothetical protein H671_2g7458, partial [Cricetulus griseus]
MQPALELPVKTHLQNQEQEEQIQPQLQLLERAHLEEQAHPEHPLQQPLQQLSAAALGQEALEPQILELEQEQMQPPLKLLERAHLEEQ